MNVTGAAEFFNLPEGAGREEVRSRIDERLFEYKNEVLQKYIVPRLLIKRIQQITQLMLAEFVLTGKELPETGIVPVQWTERPSDRIDFLATYENHISQLKLALMNCHSFHHLHNVVQAFVVAQEYYMVLFRIMFNDFSEALPEEVNTREMIDTGKLLSALKKGELDNQQSWEIELELARIEKIRRLRSDVTGGESLIKY
ncbi:MAG: hypothetical protein IT223_10890 [Crocinitomicaceae bacterium]|nr:hypothetical protein [Crocinitomicaceae bacterium]